MALNCGIRFEPALHRPLEHQVREREQVHALVVRHEGSHDRARLAALHAGCRVVHGLVESKAALESEVREALQVFARGLGLDHQCERRGIGSDDEILREAAREAEPGHAERVVLVVEARVDGVVAGLGHAPGQGALVAVCDLPRHCRAAGLVEQRAGIGRHHQERHEVLEHRAAPGHEHGLAARRRQEPPEGKPAFLRQLPLGDRDERAKPRFRGEQVVETGVAPVVVDVVSDREQVARPVVEELVVGRREFRCLLRQSFQVCNSCDGTFDSGGRQFP